MTSSPRARDISGKGEIAWGDGSEGPHEAGLLTLETTKSSAASLGVVPQWSLYESGPPCDRLVSGQMSGNRKEPV